ncbi:RNA polymerase sigma factor [Microbacterium koreense]|uniref:RNA polymerase sigma factor n=1 Tax=Microbacterium koreense TaxID=323761 RepID=A0ABW2ZNS3_9MICO
MHTIAYITPDTGRVVEADDSASLSDADESVLAALANAGDRAAASEYFARNLPKLRIIARAIGSDIMDYEDLLSDAAATVLDKWTVGTGPTTYVTAYLAQAMRNRVRDELRSPRSRVGALVDEPVIDQSPSHRRADWHREYDLLRRALRSMPADQRTVLLATAVDGRKTGEVATEFGRDPGSVYSLLRRAKLRLRRAILAVAIDDNARGAECRALVKRLPDAVPARPDQLDNPVVVAHVRACDGCATAWSAYDSLAQAAAA